MKIDLSNAVDYIQDQFQDYYYDYIERLYRIYVLTSGRGGGKSNAIAQSLILDSFQAQGNILVVQSTYAAMKDATYAELTGWIDEWELNKFFDITTSPLKITNKISKKKFIFRGTDKPKKLKSMKDIETVWIEEADLIDEDAWDTIKLSARGKKFNVRFILSFNPSSPYTWIKTIIDNLKLYKAKHYKSFYYDNPYVDDDFIDEMELIKKLNPQRYLRDGLGEFTKLEGLVINTDLIKDIKEIPRSAKITHAGVGLDFGFNHNQALISYKYDSINRDIYIDFTLAESNLTNDEFINIVPSKYRSVLKATNGYADSARPELIKEWNQYGYKFKSAKKDKLEVMNYVYFMNELNNIYVLDDAAAFKIECGKWDYDTKQDKPKKENDDINDALRYGLQEILLKRRGGSMQTKKSKL